MRFAPTTGVGTQPRWPAYVLSVLSLGYALGKAGYAVQGRMGFPTGPVVSAQEHVAYARDVMDVSVSQWMGSATGVLGAAVSLATVTAAGRRVPRPVMLGILTVMALGVGAGAGVLVLDGFVGIGIGWQWYHGVVGAVTLVMFGLMTRSYVRATRPATAPDPVVEPLSGCGGRR